MKLYAKEGLGLWKLQEVFKNAEKKAARKCKAEFKTVVRQLQQKATQSQTTPGGAAWAGGGTGGAGLTKIAPNIFSMVSGQKVILRARGYWAGLIAMHSIARNPAPKRWPWMTVSTIPKWVRRQFRGEKGWAKGLSKSGAVRRVSRAIHLPARPIYPTGDVPGEWREVLTKTAAEVYDSYLKAGGAR